MVLCSLHPSLLIVWHAALSGRWASADNMGLSDIVRSPFVALGAAASVPLVVSSSEQWGTKQLGGVVSVLLANTRWAQVSSPLGGG